MISREKNVVITEENIAFHLLLRSRMSASTLLSGTEAFCDANSLQSSRGEDDENLIHRHDLRMEEQHVCPFAPIELNLLSDLSL